MKTEKNVVAAPVQYFPLDRLYLSDMNPRQDADAERIDLLADSIIACGLIQNRRACRCRWTHCYRRRGRRLRT